MHSAATTCLPARRPAETEAHFITLPPRGVMRSRPDRQHQLAGRQVHANGFAELAFSLRPEVGWAWRQGIERKRERDADADVEDDGGRAEDEQVAGARFGRPSERTLVDLEAANCLI